MTKITLALVCLFLPLVASATDLTLTCTPPTKFDDGSTITTPIQFNFYGALQGQPKVLLAPSPLPTCASVRQNVRSGVQCYEVTALVGGAESVHTAETCIPVDVPPVTCPAQPAPETRAQACVAPLVGSFSQSRTYSSVAAPACWQAGAWTPDTAPAGVCALPSPLVTADTKAYVLKGTTTLTLVGLVVAGTPCGPQTQVVNGLKYCRVGKSQVDMVVWPSDLTLTDFWAKAAP